MSGSLDSSIKVWVQSAAGWACERTLGLASLVWSLLMCGDKLVAGLHNGSIMVKSTEGEWETERTLTGHTSNAKSLALYDGKLVSGSVDHTIKVWA